MSVSRTDYSKMAEPYSLHRRAHPGVLDELCAELSASSCVLEVGCGTGNYLTAIFRSTGCRCVGIDPSPEMLAKLHERGLPVQMVETIRASAEQLDMFREQFDFVYSVDVIHHIQDREAAFRGAFQSLKSGGRICTVTDSEWIIRHRQPQSVYFPETIEVELARYPPIPVVRAETTDAGFSEIHEKISEYRYELTDAAAYRNKVFSSLLHIGDAAFERGLAKLEADLSRGQVQAVARYVLVWGTKP
jgi:ubiquinone/menaquinone biosynthesis C-methylase UbiE